MITINEVSYSYNKHLMALKNIYLEIPKGFTLLIGENGSGKTTLLKALSSILTVQGDIFIDDIHVADKRYKHIISYLPQEFYIYPKLKVFDILHFVASMKGISKNNIRKEIERIAEYVNITSYLNTRFNKCSVGTRRRVGIAASLLGDPQAVFLDEPTAGIDPKERISFYKTIKNIFNNKYVLISTHILDDIEILADYIVMISKGRIVYSGNYTDFIHSLDGRLFEYRVPKEGHHELISNVISYTESNEIKVYRYFTNQKQRKIFGSTQIAPTIEDIWIYFHMKEDSCVE